MLTGGALYFWKKLTNWQEADIYKICNITGSVYEMRLYNLLEAKINYGSIV